MGWRGHDEPRRGLLGRGVAAAVAAAAHAGGDGHERAVGVGNAAQRLAVGPVQTFTLGRPVQGRAIQATELGDPAAPLKLLVVGVIHGNETAGRAVVRALVAQEAPPRGRPLDGRRPEPGWVAAVTRQRLLPCITIWFHQPLAVVDESGGSGRSNGATRGKSAPSLRRPPRYHGSARELAEHAHSRNDRVRGRAAAGTPDRGPGGARPRQR